MPGFSTLALGGTIISPIRLNYDLSISSSTTVALAYSTAGITDIVGLQVVIYNNSSSSITLTAGTQFDNHESYPGYCAAANTLLIPARQTVTLITKTIGQDYTISAISGMLNIDKGAAGNIVYQTAANRTGFLAAGTQDYILKTGGPSQPPYWSLLQTGNLAGGVAGSLDYQSGPNATAKSAAGNAFSNGGGGIAGMTSNTTVGWNNLSLLNGLNNSVYSGDTLTINNPRGWVFAGSAIGGFSGNLYSFMAANSVPQYDGNIYTIYNDSSSNYVLTIKNIINPNSWSNSLITSFAPDANQITLYPHETITFQQWNATYLAIVAATQSLGLSAVYTIAAPTTTSSGTYYPAVGSVVFDNQGWNSVGDTTYTVGQTGLYRYTIYFSQSNAFNTIPVINAYKNTNSGPALFSALIRNPNDVVNNGTYFLTFDVQMNAGDYIVFLVNSRGSLLFVGGLVTMTLLN